MKKKTATNLKVLILEDSIRDMELMREQLSSAGYRLDVTHVENEADYTSALRENSFDLILADFKLPDFDGFGALKISRELCPETPFICVSGTIGEETAVELLKLGASDYVLKDKPEKLPTTIKRALEEAKVKAEFQKSEEDLQKSEEKFKNIFHNHAAVKLIINPENGDIKEANKAASDFYGWSAEELQQMNIAQINLLTPREIKKEIEKAMSLKKTHFEFRHRKADGRIIDIEAFISKIVIEGKDYLHTIVHDITEKKQAEKELNEQKELLTAIYRNAPLVMMVVNKDRRIQQVNGFATQFANRDADEMLGLRGGEALRCMHVLDDPEGCGFGDFCQQCVIRNSVLDTLETGKTHLQLEAPYFYQWEDNHIQEMTFLTSTKPIMVKGERMVLVTLQDITKRKQAEESLRESEEKYRTLVNSTLQGVIIAKPNPVRLVFANPAMAQISGYSSERLVEMGPGELATLIYKEDQQRFFANFQKRIKGENIPQTNEYRMVTKNGTIKWVALYSSKIEYKNEPATLTTFMDITGRKQAEESLRESEKHNAFLAQTAFELTELTSIQEIYTYTVQKLYELMEGNAIVALVEFHQSENRWKMQQIKGVGKKVAKLNKLLGFDINKMEGDISTKYYEQISSGKLEELDFDLPGLFNNKLMAATGKAVKRLFSIEKLYCISYRQDEQIIGNITIITNKNTGPIKKNLIEAFVQQICNFVKKQKAEEQLKQSEHELQEAQRLAKIGSCIFNPHTGKVIPSDEMCNIIGIEKNDEALDFKNYQKHYTPESWQKFTNGVKEALKTGEFDEIEMEIVRKDGNRTLLASAETIKDEKGKVVEFRGMQQDITERKQAEESLRQSEEKFRSYIDFAPDGIFIANENGKYMEVNQAACDITGYSEQELLNMQVPDLLQKSEIDKGVRHFQEVKEKGTARVEMGFVTKNGENRFWNIAAVKLSENRFLGFVKDITERKQAEVTLLQSEDRFKKLSSFTFEGIIIHKDAIAIDANQSFIDMLGYQRNEIVGKNLFTVIHPDYHEITIVNISKEVATPYHIVVTRKDGSTFDAEIEARNIAYNNEYFRVACIRDITERKRTEKIRQLQYNIARATISTRKLNELFDSVKNELISVIDAKNLFIALYDEESGMVHAPLFKDEKDDYREWPAEKTATGYVIKQNRPVLLKKNEILNLHKEGIIELHGTVSEAWLGVPLKVEGKIFGVVVVQSYDNPEAYNQTSVEIMQLVAHELSMFIDRQRSEEKANKLSRAIEQSSVSVAITNREGLIEYANPFFTKLTGYSFQEVKGKNFRILKSGSHSTAFYKDLWDTILSGNDWEGEFLNKKKTGELYWAKAMITPVVNSDNIITNFISIKEDITERKKMLKELVESKEKAQESDKLKTAFINNISHEIRTPLNGILGFGEILAETDPSPEEKSEMLAIVHQSGKRLMNTMTDYMDMARIVTGTMEVHKNEFLLQPFFEEVIEETRQLSAAKKIDFKTDCQIKADLSLDSDPELIKRILTILLDNALKFTASGSINCGYKPKEGFIEFFVQDTGKGIDPQKLDVIFNMFTQENPADTRAHEGSGLGLSIASGLVKLLGGSISAASKKGKGSTFTFTVPYTETELAEKAPPAEEKNDAVEGKPLVLLAEDEESNYLYMEVVLKKAGFDYLLAKNGEEAVDLCEKYPGITLVLMDIKMPVMNGLEATRLIREFRPELPIIATTAYVQTGDEQRFLAAGCDGYLPKPIRKERLLAVFQKYLK